MPPVSQGAKANLNGRIFEQQCIPMFQACGFTVYSHKEFLKAEQDGTLPDKYVIKDAPFQTIYKHKGKTEFLMVINSPNGKREIRVENKFQAKAGSVDEKYPYTLLNAIFAYPEKEVIIIIDGGGYKAGARQWVLDMVQNNWLDYKRLKKITIMHISEFLAWVTDEFS